MNAITLEGHPVQKKILTAVPRLRTPLRRLPSSPTPQHAALSSLHDENAGAFFAKRGIKR